MQSKIVTNTSYVSPLPTKSLTLWGPRNKEYSRTLSQHNKKVIRYKYLMTFLVRWKGLEPPTYWFVAAKIWLKYSKYGYFKPFLLYKICPQFHRSFYSLIIYILQVVTIVVKIQLQAYWILIRILYTELVDDFADNLKLISNNIEKFNN